MGGAGSDFHAAAPSGQELGRTLDAVRNEVRALTTQCFRLFFFFLWLFSNDVFCKVYLACNQGRFHANVALDGGECPAAP